MRMVGHRTESVYRRYAVVDEAMLREGAAKLHALQVAEGLSPASSRALSGESGTTSERIWSARGWKDWWAGRD
jgi:hypothetical protein